MSAARVREALGETPASMPSGNRGARGRVAWVAAGTGRTGGAECCAPRPARFQRRPRLTSGEAALRARLRRPRRAGTSIVAGAMVPEVPPSGNRGARGRAPWLPNGRLARSAALREGGGALDAACAGRLGGCQAVDGGGGSPSDGLAPPGGCGASELVRHGRVRGCGTGGQRSERWCVVIRRRGAYLTAVGELGDAWRD